MISPRRLIVGTEPVSLTEGSGNSAATIQYLRNRGDTDLYVGEPDGGIPLEPGEQLSGLSLGSTDRLEVVRRDGEGPVDVVVGWA